MRHVDDNALARLCDSLHREFENVVSANGERRIHLGVAKHSVEVRIAHEALDSLTRPLLHLKDRGGLGIGNSESWQLMAWGFSGHAPHIHMPWQDDDQSFLGSISGIESLRYRVNFHPPAQLLCVMDLSTRCAYYRIAHYHDLPYWEQAAPFRTLFHWLFQQRGCYLAHAAAVGHNEEGILLVGRGGFGKSSLTMACIGQGMTCLGDDFLILGSGPVAYTLYNCAKLQTEFQRSRFPHLTNQVAMEIGPERKSVFFLDEWDPSPVADRFAIRAVVIPCITDNSRPSLERTSAAKALLALAPSTIFQFPGSAQTALSYFRAWLESLPVFVLRTGSSLGGASKLIQSMVKSLDSTRTDAFQLNSLIGRL